MSANPMPPLFVDAWHQLEPERVEISVEGKDLIDSLPKHNSTAKCIVKAQTLITVLHEHAIGRILVASGKANAI